MMGDVIDKPGVYDIPAARYHKDPVVEPSLSNSIAKILLNKSPLHAAAHHPRLAINPIKTEKDQFDLGKAAHTLLLRDGQKFEVVRADNWQTKAARDKKQEARHAGLIPILEYQFDNTVEMVEACRAQLAEHEVGDILAEGKGEQTLVWQEDGVWCRSLVDWMPLEVEEECTIVDYKTTGASAHPALWGLRTGPAIGFDFQNAFYQRGIRRIFKIRNFRFLFLIQENQPPYCISVVEVDRKAMMEAMHHVKTAVGMWRTCMQRGAWPGYPADVIKVSPRMRLSPDPYDLEEVTYV